MNSPKINSTWRFLQVHTKWKNFKKSDPFNCCNISLCFLFGEKLYLLFQNTLYEQKYLSHKYLNDGTRPTLDYKGPRLIWKILINPNSLVGFLKTNILKTYVKPDSQPTSLRTFSKKLNPRCLFLITTYSFPLGSLLGCSEFVIFLKHCHF